MILYYYFIDLYVFFYKINFIKKYHIFYIIKKITKNRSEKMQKSIDIDRGRFVIKIALI